MYNTQNQAAHEELKALSQAVYYDNSQVPKGYMRISHFDDSKNGFYAEAYARGKDIIVVYCGTDADRGKIEQGKDFISDGQMLFGHSPWQKQDAEKFYNDLKKDFPDSKFVFTGHSLGGSLAQIMGAKTGQETVTFGAYGTQNLGGVEINHSANITNYGSANDPVFVKNIKNQVGRTMVLDAKNVSVDGFLLDTPSLANATNISSHYVQNLGKLSEAAEYWVPSDVVLAGGAGAEFQYLENDPDRLITGQEIGALSQDEFNANSDYYQALSRSGNVVSADKLNDTVAKGGAVWVERISASAPCEQSEPSTSCEAGRGLPLNCR